MKTDGKYDRNKKKTREQQKNYLIAKESCKYIREVNI